MNQTIYFSDYKFDIELVNTSINIKVFNTTSLDLYEGSVNEAEIYVQPISKFYKMLVSGLNKENNFNFEINNLTDKLKCRLNYLNEFVDIEEFIILNKKANNKAVEYYLNNKIEVLEEKNKLLNTQVDSLRTELIQIKSSIQLLEKYAFLIHTYTYTVSCNNGNLQSWSPINYVPINNCTLEINNSGVGISPNNLWHNFTGCTFYTDYVKNLVPFNPNKIRISNNITLYGNEYKEVWGLTPRINFLTQYLSSKLNVIFDEINIENTLDDIIYVLTLFKNYKMICIKKLDGKIPSDYNYIKTHCKDNGIQFILT